MRNQIVTLAVALIEGIHEDPLWHSFLNGLVTATGADVVTLAFHPPGWEHAEGLLLASTGVSPESMRENQRRYGYPDNAVARERMVEGQPYSFAEIIAWDMVEHRNFFEANADFGITDARQMRVQEVGGVDAWLTAVSLGGSFGPDVDELLGALAPLLRGVLHTYVAREQERFAADLTGDTVRRLQFGWIALDVGGRVVRADPFGENVLATSGVLLRDRQGRLEVRPPELQREIEAALGKLIDGGSPRAIPLRADPWLDMLLVRASHKPLAASGAPDVIAYVHGDNWSASDRQSQLSELFALSASEARLALALCRGRSIAEAAGDAGLTEQTARTYSKAIYAKTGARGQPDLVRIVMGSILALAPEG